MEISQKRFEIEAWYQLPTNRKWPMTDRMMALSMNSHDFEMSLRPVISRAARNRDSVTTEHL